MLPVREAELAVEWLFRDEAQKSSLAAASAVPGERLKPHTGSGHCVYPGEPMSRRDPLLLLLLSAIWGASFLSTASLIGLGLVLGGAALATGLARGRAASLTR
jgi:hypothetical protein